VSIQDDIQIIGAALRGDRQEFARIDPERAFEAWERIKAAAILSQPAFPSFLGFMIAVDPTLAEGVIEFRDNAGKVLGTLKAEKRA
jgi:hypothetical protein